MCCRFSTSCIRSSTGARRGPIRGVRRGSNGRRRRRRPRTILRRRRSWCAGRTNTNWRRPKMSSDLSILTPDEREALDHSVLVRHPLEEQYHDLEQQHEAASLGMWVFLGTEVMLFGGLFTGLAMYHHLYQEAFEKASVKLNWKIGG